MNARTPCRSARELLPDGARALPPVGARRAPRRARAQRRRRARRRADAARCRAAGSSSTLPRAAAGDALPLSHRRRARGARPGLALQSRRRARARARSSIPRAFDWHDAGWRGRPWHEAVIYELHVGTLHARGHVRAARSSASTTCATLGVTAIELMPVADFPGRRNWGYDGVLPFAPDAALRHARRPEAPGRRRARARPDGAARRRLQPLRPRGQLPARATRRTFFNPTRHTPWGAAINFDGPRQPRRCATSSSTTRCTGSRSSTSTACASTRCTRSHDDSRPHIADEIAQALRSGPGRERHVHLVLENDRNEARGWCAHARGAPRFATAQWNDDVHHALHVLVTGERDGYYADYADAPLRAARARAGRRLRLPGRALAVSRRRAARRAERAPAAARLRHLPAEPRPGRQPRARRAPRRARRRRRAARARCACLLLAPHGADALHGRGIRGRARRSCSSATSTASWRAR